MKKIPVIIDCDPGVDDVFAIILAAAKEELDIRAITSVSGNVGIEYTTHNAQLTAGLLDLDAEVGQGADRPLVKNPIFSEETHGLDGFGGYAHLIENDKLKTLYSGSALDLQLKVLRESKEKVSIIAVGPLTNIAILLTAHPEIADKIEQISIMGGGIGVGNSTSTAEFNYYIDPEAAQIVMNSGIKLIMCGLNVTLVGSIKESDIEVMEKIDTNIAKIGSKILSYYAAQDAALHDPCAVLAITNPEIFKGTHQRIQVDVREGITRGMSYVDEVSSDEKPNCYVIYDMDRELFIDEVIKSLEFFKNEY